MSIEELPHEAKLSADEEGGRVDNVMEQKERDAQVCLGNYAQMRLCGFDDGKFLEWMSEKGLDEVGMPKNLSDMGKARTDVWARWKMERPDDFSHLCGAYADKMVPTVASALDDDPIARAYVDETLAEFGDIQATDAHEDMPRAA